MQARDICFLLLLICVVSIASCTKTCSTTCGSSKLCNNLCKIATNKKKLTAALKKLFANTMAENDIDPEAQQINLLKVAPYGKKKLFSIVKASAKTDRKRKPTPKKSKSPVDALHDEVEFSIIKNLPNNRILDFLRIIDSISNKSSKKKELPSDDEITQLKNAPEKMLFKLIKNQIVLKSIGKRKSNQIANLSDNEQEDPDNEQLNHIRGLPSNKLQDILKRAIHTNAATFKKKANYIALVIKELKERLQATTKVGAKTPVNSTMRFKRKTLLNAIEQVLNDTYYDDDIEQLQYLNKLSNQQLLDILRLTGRTSSLKNTMIKHLMERSRRLIKK